MCTTKFDPTSTQKLKFNFFAMPFIPFVHQPNYLDSLFHIIFSQKFVGCEGLSYQALDFWNLA